MTAGALIFQLFALIYLQRLAIPVGAAGDQRAARRHRRWRSWRWRPPGG